MSWRDDDEVSEEQEGSEYPSIKGFLDKTRKGDVVTFKFLDEGELVDNEYGKSVRFHVIPIESDVPLELGGGDDAKMDDGEIYSFFCSSNRLNKELKDQFDSLEDKTVAIEILDTGYDMAYRATEA